MSQKILIVDDDPKNLELILEYLAAEPFEIIYAANGQRALKLAKDEMPDLIIMDWEMPILNGIEAVKELKKDTATQKIPIIIATGVMVEPTDLEEALDTGAVDFLRKPFNPIEFNARVRSNIRLREQHETITRLLRESLQRKERELASSALFEHEKNTLLAKLIEQLEKITPLPDAEAGQQINDIKRQLKSQLNLKKSWDSFKVHFEEVHPDFFTRLEKRHPTLSLTEKRMCAFMKIGLDNKEIALLTNVEAGSVRKSLNRLKNKLELPAEAVLREFITQI